ncbi:Polyribonucleotide nucleotidyltransferase (polynucleotide phosphorylase) [Streptomyces sp. cf386]|nr:Polyribonucleotide nucleotidyltransferase (polynucleotide phosphorylase) [Streptomyces sp. cf386]
MNAAALTMQIVSWLRPEALLFVGVAGSLKHDIGIGDVVVATKVYGIHGGRQTPEGFHARPEVWHGSHRLVQAARSALRGMLGVHYKPVAVGDVVLADDRSVLAEHIRRHYNDACAIEMEGSGAAHAAYLSGQLDTLIVRGISDLANAEKHKADASGSQSQAAERAALAAVTVLRKQQPASSPAVSLQPSRRDPEPVDVGVGERYLGTVLRTVTFGAFVSVLPGKDGLLHISQIRKLVGGKRVDEVADVLSVGARVWVEVAEIDKHGKISLKPVIENGNASTSRKTS